MGSSWSVVVFRRDGWSLSFTAFIEFIILVNTMVR